MPLPADAHVHSEYPWDTGGPDSAARGTMAATCARAEAIGAGFRPGRRPQDLWTR